MSQDGLAAAGLIQVGSLVEYAYKIRLPGVAGESQIAALRQTADERFPTAGWSVRSRSKRCAGPERQHYAVFPSSSPSSG